MAGRCRRGELKGSEELLGVVNMFIILIVVVALQMYSCVKIYQIMHCKQVQFMYVNYSSIKLIKREKYWHR